MQITFTTSELSSFFRELPPQSIEKHLKRTILATRKAGIPKLEKMIEQGAIEKELFDKIKLAVENPNFEIIII